MSAPRTPLPTLDEDAQVYFMYCQCLDYVRPLKKDICVFVCLYVCVYVCIGANVCVCVSVWDCLRVTRLPWLRD